ncbi:MAG: HU family DNA-binding protein [bacterium]
MNKSELVEKIGAIGITKKQAEDSLNATLEAITNALKKGDSVTLVGFGTFKVVKRAARVGINPSTREKMKIPAKKVPKFSAGKSLKSIIAGSKK